MRDTTSGTGVLDTLIDGVHVGDNLVLRGGQGAPLPLLVERFVAATRGHRPLAIVRTDGAPVSGVPAGAVLLDWSPALTGRPSPHVGALAPGDGLAEALASLEAADDALGEGAAFVFDLLSSLPPTWGDDAGLELFLAACPRLYRRRSLALWPVRSDRHRPAFLRRLEEVTQVVVDLTAAATGWQVTVRKADGRPAAVAGRNVHAEVVAGDLRATEGPVGPKGHLGTAIREQRLVRGLSQTEVAHRVGISPSALSQVERGVRGPSGDTLVRLWEVLGVPFGPSATETPGYVVSRRSGRTRTRLQDGLEGERLLGPPHAAETWLLRVEPGARGARAPFPVKVPETVAVLRGVIDLEFGGRTETLHEGDAVRITGAMVNGWSNPGRGSAEIVWMFDDG